MVLGACRNTVDTDVGLSQPPDRQVLGEWIGGSEVTRVGHVVRLKQRRCYLEMTKNLLELNATPPELNQPMPLRSNDSRLSAALGLPRPGTLVGKRGHLGSSEATVLEVKPEVKHRGFGAIIVLLNSYTECLRHEVSGDDLIWSIGCHYLRTIPR